MKQYLTHTLGKTGKRTDCVRTVVMTLSSPGRWMVSRYYSGGSSAGGWNSAAVELAFLDNCLSKPETKYNASLGFHDEQRELRKQLCDALSIYGFNRAEFDVEYAEYTARYCQNNEELKSIYGGAR